MRVPVALALLILGFWGIRCQDGNDLNDAKLCIYVNGKLSHGEVTKIVLTMEKIPYRHPIDVRLSSKNYIIAYFRVGPKVSPVMPPTFKKTNRISRVLAKENIKPSGEVSYEAGFYAVLSASFWSLTDIGLTLFANVPDKPWIENVKIVLELQMDLGEGCVPDMVIKNCLNSEQPLQVHVARDMTLIVAIHNSCGFKPREFNWTITDIEESKIYFQFNSNVPRLLIKRFSLRYIQKHEFWKNLFVVLLTADFNGRNIMARGYVRRLLGTVEAIIFGGNERVVQESALFYMNATLSRDYSKRTNEKQFSTYEWICESWDDYRNPYCSKKMATSALFSIPAFRFKTGCTYYMRLKVQSEFDATIISNDRQVITVVKHALLEVSIQCLSNCIHEMYSPTAKVKLQGLCLNCGSGKIRYQWYVGGVFTLEKRELSMFIHTPARYARIVLKIYTVDGRKGEDFVYLLKNLGPTDGNCVIAPTDGDEFSTPFYVCCQNFKTKNEPIEFFYYAGRVLLNKCFSCTCEIHLPETKSVKVLICDGLFACAEKHLAVKIKPATHIPVDSPEAVRNFTTTPPNDIVSLFESGAFMRALQTIDSVGKRLDHVSKCNELIKVFEQYQTKSIPSLGKHANLLLKFAINLTPIDMEEAVLLLKSLTTLNENFQYLHDMNTYVLLIEHPYLNITQSCVSVYHAMKRLAKQLHNPPQTIYDKYVKGPLEQKLIDELMKEINTISDPTSRKRARLWVQYNWQSERLRRFLGFARDHGIEPDALGDVVTEGVAFAEQCFDIEPQKDYIIDTKDGMHKVNFSAGLLQEMKTSDSNNICISVLSIMRELNWWYPEEKQPSSILLSVRIYQGEDTFTEEIWLKSSELSFTTIIGKYKPASTGSTTDLHKSLKINFEKVEQANRNDPTDLPVTMQVDIEDTKNDIEYAEDDYVENINTTIMTEPTIAITQVPAMSIIDEVDEEEKISNVGKYINCLEPGEIDFMQDVRVYRILVDGKSMLAVRFTNCTHKLNAILRTNNQPLRAELASTKCFVPAGTQNKTMLLRNKCPQPQRAYLGLRVWSKEPVDDNEGVLTPVVDGPASFAFVFQIRSCDHWMYSLPEDDQRWSPVGCLPELTYRLTDGMRCICNVLGTYTTYVYNVQAIPVPVDSNYIAAINFYVLYFYLVTWPALLLIIIWVRLYYNKASVNYIMCEMTDMEQVSRREVHDLLVYIKTGGRISAATTANVKLSFLSTQISELQFTIIQDPLHPYLDRNSTQCLWLRTRDIRLPTKIAVSHNGDGRYPSWFLRRIELQDLQAQETQIFIVRRWVRNKIIVLTSAIMYRPGELRIFGNWWRRFQLSFEVYWTNWGLWQPLTGGWRGPTDQYCLTRCERVCVFISKLAVSFCITAIYMGRTTPDSVEKEREKYTQVVHFNEVLIVSIIAYLVNILVQAFYEVVLFKYKRKK